MTSTTASPRRSAHETTPVRASSRPDFATVISTLALAAALVALPFVTDGGVDMSDATAGNTWADVGLTLIGAAVTAVGIVRAHPGRRAGMATIAAMATLTALEALSIIWSVTPDVSWLGVNQMLAYLAVFAAAATTARTVPTGWPVVIGAIALAVAAVCGWSLLVKVFPATLAAGNQYGRLQAPYGYWNACGVIAAVGLPCLLWCGARRDHGRRLAALAAPAIALVFAVLVLSYSRSADLAAVVAGGLWLIFVPLRLRAVAIAAVGLLGGMVISIWGLTHTALSGDKIAMPVQDHAGHTFGIVMLVAVVLSAVVGDAVARAMDQVTVPQITRRRWGTGLLGLVGLIPVAVIVALAHSSRGLTGEVSYGWQQLTSTTSITSNTAGRVLQFGSSRPVYWHDALDVGGHALFKGVGELGFAIARLRWSTNTSVVQSAHSFVFQTFADLGVLGLVVTAALFAAWVLETGRTLQPRERWAAFADEPRAEREVLLTLTAAVIGFGIQSTIDWTWFFAGVAVPVLIAAGWVAGRGPVTEPAPAEQPTIAADPGARRSLLDRPAAAAAVVLIAAIGLCGAWLQWQPLRSNQQLTAAENASTFNGISQAATSADHLDPLSVEPLTILSSLYQDVHEPTKARDELVAATRRQPGNPATWDALALFDYDAGHYHLAIASLNRVLALDVGDDFEHNQAAQLIERSQGAIAAATAKQG